MKKEINAIREKLPTEELLAQLAEECIELGHAALKLRRVLFGLNPTPTPHADAYENVQEEIADILLVLKVLGYDYQSACYREMMNCKAQRWVNRLSGKDDLELEEGSGGN